MKRSGIGRTDGESIYALVEREGAMRPREVLRIAERLLKYVSEEETVGCLHPKNVLLDRDGSVRIGAREVSPSERERYAAPERGEAPPARVYEAGMLLCYMATGEEMRGELIVKDGRLRALLLRSVAFDPSVRFQSLSELSDAVRHVRRARIAKIPRAVLFLLLSAILFFLGREGRRVGSRRGEEEGEVAGYAAGYEKGFADAPGIGMATAEVESGDGNLSGNLSTEDGSTVAQSATEIFFALKGTLYRTDPYTGAIRTLLSDVNACGLNWHDGFLYYATDRGIFRIDPDHPREELFVEFPGAVLTIADGGFYLYDRKRTKYLYRIDPDTRVLTQLNGTSEYRCLNVVDGKLYYIDPEQGDRLYRSDPDGSNARLVHGSPCRSFCVRDGRIYVSAAEPFQGLIRMDLDGGDSETLSKGFSDLPNACAGGVFHLAGNRKTLEWISADGKRSFTVVSTETGDYHVAGRWIFYRNEEDGGSLWRVGFDGRRLERLTP